MAEAGMLVAVGTAEAGIVEIAMDIVVLTTTMQAVLAQQDIMAQTVEATQARIVDRAWVHVPAITTTVVVARV
jgi:hypothetical protein